MIKPIHYQLQLTTEQADFLANTTYGHNRMSYLVSLIKTAALKPYPSLVNGSKETVGVGMVERSIKQLSGDWKLDYKTTKEMLKAMNDLGIVTTKSTPQTSTHLIHVVAAWIVDTTTILNPHFVRGYDKHLVRSGNFDTTAIAEDFIPIMEESIASYMKNLPKGGRGKRKPSASAKVILPTINGLELYGQMLAKVESHSDESDTQADVPESSTPSNAIAEGSGSFDESSADEAYIATELPSVDNSNEKFSDATSSGETEESCNDSSVSDSSETTDEQHTSVSENAPEAVVYAPTAKTTEQQSDNT